MLISIIAAIGKNREIGYKNKLLWHIPEDLARFKKITLGHPVIMGRKTFESIGKPLPGRFNIVVTYDRNFQAPPGATVCHSLKDAITLAKKTGTDEVFIIGGASIYEQALPLADKLYLTLVEDTKPADTYFPDYSQFKKIIFKEEHQKGNLKYTFLELLRDKTPGRKLRDGP